MAKKEYGWLLGDAPPVIDLHSITKHRVYEEYLCHYIQVLNSNPLIPKFSLNIIDGFSGGGEYLHPTSGEIHEGSPIRLIKSAYAAEAAINTHRQQGGINNKFKLYAKYYFIESKKSNFDYLKDCLRRHEYLGKHGKNIITINSSFKDKVSEIVQDIGKQSGSHRCLFILDQYGYSEVPFSNIKYIFERLPNAEIILTFATDWLIDYMSDDPRYLKGLKKSGIDEILDINELLERKLDTKEWRQFVQFELHLAIKELSGAKYYTPFFIVSGESNRSFWLLHLSNHPRARDVMTQLHWSLKNHFAHYGGHGFNMFGYNPRFDDEITGVDDLFSNTEFTFNEMAMKQTLEGVVDEMPALIHDFKEGVSFGEFYKLVSNSTPATTDIIKQGAEVLIEGKELEIHSIDGKRRKSSNTIRDTDIVSLPNQGRLISTDGKSLINLSKNKKDGVKK